MQKVYGNYSEVEDLGGLFNARRGKKGSWDNYTGAARPIASMSQRQLKKLQRKSRRASRKVPKTAPSRKVLKNTGYVPPQYVPLRDTDMGNGIFAGLKMK